MPLLVAYFTLTAPVVPPLRFTDNVAEPLLLLTVYAREENATACADAADPVPVVVTVVDVAPVARQQPGILGTPDPLADEAPRGGRAAGQRGREKLSRMSAWTLSFG